MVIRVLISNVPVFFMPVLRTSIWNLYHIGTGAYAPAYIMSVLRTFVSQKTKPRRGGIKQAGGVSPCKRNRRIHIEPPSGVA